MKNILAQLKNNPVVTKLGLAGAISMVSLLASWSAIIVLLQGNLPWAITLAIIAFLLDSLDGFTARKLGKASEFGRQLDGMIDAFNYSLFAAVLVQQVLLPGVLGYITGFAILAFGILRLIVDKHDIAKAALKEKDYAAQIFLQWFINEQVEEEATAQGIVDKLKKAGDAGIFFIDSQLGQR